ncbi:hypothetical protein [Halomonas korlensis]|nr:hypothetical protein [Halomonas korlensis]
MQEVRNTNSGLMASYIICNSYLLLKDQQVRDLYNSFREKREEYQRVISGELKGQYFEYEADMRRVILPKIPLDLLNQQVYQKMNLNGRPVSATAQIDNTIASLESAIETRDSVIQMIRRSPEMDEAVKAKLYFGFPLPDGSLSTEYADALEGISTYVDDVVFYSNLLCEDLFEHGQKIRKRLKDQYREEPPEVNKVDFADAEEKGLMPDKERYANWLQGHRTISSNESEAGWFDRLLKKMSNKSRKTDA